MKKIIVILAALALSGCTSKTEFGECIGAFDDGDPALQYKLSVWNTILGVVFVETIIVPVVVVADQIRCPVGVKPKAQGAAKGQGGAA